MNSARQLWASIPLDARRRIGRLGDLPIPQIMAVDKAPELDSPYNHYHVHAGALCIRPLALPPAQIGNTRAAQIIAEIDKFPHEIIFALRIASCC